MTGERWVTNRASLRAVCLTCAAVKLPDELTPWPSCCDIDMLVVNTTNREGKPVELGGLKLQDADEAS